MKRSHGAVIVALLSALPIATSSASAQALTPLRPPGRPSGPQVLPIYPQAVLANLPVAYWHLGETSGSTASDSAGSHDGRYVGNPVLGRTGLIADWSNGCPRLDGVDDRVTANSLASGVNWSNGFTLEAWVRVTQRAVEETLLSFNLSGGLNGPGIIRDEPTDRFKYRDGEGATGHSALSKTIPQVGRRYYVVVRVAPSGRAALFVNGSIEAEFTTSALPPSRGGLFTIGAEYDAGPTPTSFWHGPIDEVAVYNHALSATRIQAHWLAGRWGIG
jgi:hypothetical protein